MTLEELKQFNRKAYRSLLVFWSELSRISVRSARIDLENDMGSRYTLEEDTLDGEDKFIIFTDSHVGDVFVYFEEDNYWKCL